MKLLCSFKTLFFLVTLAFISACSCNNDNDKDGIINDKDKCPNSILNVKVDANGCPIKEKEIGNIHFYIDNSASMDGYFNRGKETEFRTILSDLTAIIDKTIKPIDIRFITDSISRQFKAEEFSSQMATNRIANKDGYQIQEMISQIVQRSDSNDITILVSDYILSYPDAEIKKNPEINRTNAPIDLKTKIYSTFSDLKKEGLATSIYAFNSKFYGTYYDYQNGKHQLSGEKRPFFILVIGNKELLNKFNSKLSDISTFKPEKYLHFGLLEDPVVKYDIIPQIEGKGDWMKCSTGLEDIVIPKYEAIQFCVGINLENLPPYAQDINYLQDNLVLDVNGCEAKHQVKDKMKVDKSKLKTEPQIKLFENASHVIIITVTAMQLSEAKIHVTLPLKYDTWYLDWSCNDDREILNTENKTFAFEYLINGVKEAYETKNKNYIDFSITLKK